MRGTEYTDDTDFVSAVTSDRLAPLIPLEDAVALVMWLSI